MGFPELLGYQQRLVAANISTLAMGRKFYDLCMVHKIVHSDNCHRFFSIAESSLTRGHNLKIVKQFSRLEIRRLFFSQRIVNSWNQLPANIVYAESSIKFNSLLSNFLGVC